MPGTFGSGRLVTGGQVLRCLLPNVTGSPGSARAPMRLRALLLGDQLLSQHSQSVEQFLYPGPGWDNSGPCFTASCSIESKGLRLVCGGRLLSSLTLARAIETTKPDTSP